ncbi:hypothetical protein GWI33_017090 [Rhynchophorus ferrugineus]|uniref:Uncharacterized protein n=1 Tax=Rhynchophorus ferrugineus TaxID=354439 RepID=A0A834HWM7_RHYFE|nr:hypothetical protein GWI33_017090 [Rhynchophorus ferrugineus]
MQIHFTVKKGGSRRQQTKGRTENNSGNYVREPDRDRVRAYLECSYLDSATLDVRLVLGRPCFVPHCVLRHVSPTPVARCTWWAGGTAAVAAAKPNNSQFDDLWTI